MKCPVIIIGDPMLVICIAVLLVCENDGFQILRVNEEKNVFVVILAKQLNKMYVPLPFCKNERQRYILIDTSD